MADALDNPFGEPISMSDALNIADNLIDQAGEPEIEADPVEEPESEEISSEDEPTTEEPIQEEEGPQILNFDEYGDVLVDLDGTETSLNDLKAGNLRQADYSRKTAELAQERKDMQAELEERAAALAEREQQLNALMAENIEQEPDWIKLAEEDPLGWGVEKAKWEAKAKAQQEAAMAQAHRQQEAMEKFIAETSVIAVRTIPEWSDAKKFDEGAAARRAQALEVGFTNEEYDSTRDFRVAALLEKAVRYDAIMADQKSKSDLADKKLGKAKKVLKPGQSRGEVDPKSERRAAFQKRLSKPVSSDTIRDMIGR